MLQTARVFPVFEPNSIKISAAILCISAGLVNLIATRCKWQAFRALPRVRDSYQVFGEKADIVWYGMGLLFIVGGVWIVAR